MEIAPEVYVDAAMDDALRQQLLDAIAPARQRVRRYFPSEARHPVVVACSSRACFRSLGGRGGRGLSFEVRVLLAPSGISAEIVAHEWTHLAVGRALGRWRNVPSWFGEGLAVVVSEDERYSHQVFLRYQQDNADAQERLRAIAQGVSLEEFFQHEWAYLLAAEQVRRLLPQEPSEVRALVKAQSHLCLAL